MAGREPISVIEGLSTAVVSVGIMFGCGYLKISSYVAYAILIIGLSTYTFGRWFCEIRSTKQILGPVPPMLRLIPLMVISMLTFMFTSMAGWVIRTILPGYY